MTETIIIVCTIILIAVLIVIFNLKANKKVKISFREAMDLADLPIVTFYTSNNNKLNFLLDTGSNLSFIDPRAVAILGCKNSEKDSTSVIGCGGNSGVTNKYKATLMYKDNLFDTELLENPALTEAFSSVKKQDGIQIHGILGSLFFKKYEYILDFAELVAYRK